MVFERRVSEGVVKVAETLPRVLAFCTVPHMTPGTVLYAALALGTAAVLAVLPVHNLFTGMYAWHVKQPQTTEGGMELLGLLALLLVAASARARVFIVAAGLLSALYLNLHHVLVGAVSSWLLFEILMSIGAVVSQALRLPIPTGILRHLESFVVGFLVWALCVFVASALGYGRFQDVRWLTAVLGLPSLFLAKQRTLARTVVDWLSSAPWSQRALSLLVLWILLWQLARSVRTADYDSVWYGLRPEYVLMGQRSIFEDVGFGHFVYYYPKLMELLFLPLSGFRQYSFILDGNVGVLGLTLLTTYRLSRELRASTNESLAFSAAVGALPVVSNMATVSKGDLLSCLCILLAALFWTIAYKKQSAGYAIMGLAVGGLSPAARLTAFLYFPPVLAGFALVLLSRFIGKKSRPKWLGLESAPLKGPALVLTGSFLVVACVFWRTYWVTGVPTYPLMVGVWQKLGFSPHYPWTLYERTGAYVELGVRTLNDVWERWYKYLITPGEYPIYTVAWPGSSAAFLLPLTVGTFVFRSRTWRLPWFVAAAAPVMMIGLGYGTFGRFWHGHGEGDGNYFMVPVVMALMASYAVMVRLPKITRHILIGALAILSTGQLLVGFVTHWSWETGTAPFSLDWTQPLSESDTRRETRLKNAGAWELEEYLAPEKSPRACAGYGRAHEGTSEISEEHVRHLNCRVEDFESLEGAFPHVLQSDTSVALYIADRKKELLFLPRDVEETRSNWPFVRVFHWLSRFPGVKRIEARNFTMLDLGPVREAAYAALIRAPTNELTAANTPVDQPVATLTGTLKATPNPISVCEGSNMGQAKLEWTVSAPGKQVEIRVGSARGVMFTSVQDSGSVETPSWVQDGMPFYLVEVAGTVPITLAREEVHIVHRPCP